MARPPPLRLLMAHPDRLVLVSLGFLFVLAAAYTVAGVGMEMSAIRMTGMMTPAAGTIPAEMAGMTKLAGMTDMRAGPAPGRWTPIYAVLVVLMWWVMMVTMMIPSATPTILLHTALTRSSDPRPTPRISLSLVAGYLIVWGGFSVAATLAQWWAEAAGLVSARTMTLAPGWLGPAVLIAAGAWQVTPIKDACLHNCRSPAEYLVIHRPAPGARFGTFRLGLAHGLYCLGCCWALMALLFVGGIMNLYWIVGLAALVAAEKLLPTGPLIARLTGVGLIVSGLTLALDLL